MSISTKDQAMILKALSVASTSSHRFQHGAVLTDHGKVQAVGVNVSRNDPRNVEFPKRDSSVHAEVAVLNSIRGDTRGMTLYVARQRKDGEAAESMPCDACQRVIRAAGIKRVIYTTDLPQQYGVWVPATGVR